MNKAIRNIILIFIISAASLSADVRPRINAIYIDQKNVFDSTQADWFFGASILNAIHVVTQEYIIADELLILEGDYLDDDLLYETERNIRSTGLFTDVKIELDSLNEYTYDIYITTRDKWSTMPEFLFGTGGNTTTWGGRIREDNLLGTGTEVSVEAVNRSENDIGWQGAARLSKDRLFRSELGLTALLHSNTFRTDQNLALFKGFRSISDKYSFGIMANNTFGKDFMYSAESSEFELLNVKEKRLSGWFSRAWDNNGRVFATVLLELEDVDRGKTQYERAFDNSGKFLIAFSSVSEDYESVTNLNRYQKEDMPIGGYGTALLGKIFPIGSQGNSYYYVGAQGEKSAVLGNLYLFGQMTGGGAFSGSQGKYSYQEFLGQAFYKFSDNFMLTARLRQQSVWNWLDKDRQLILDNDYGLRGFKANSFSGDNRIITNTELRYFPDISIWIFKLSGVLFYDGGTVWNQETDLIKTDWHNSVGFGIRIHNMKSTGETSIFRVDFAFNADEGKFGEIIFTSDQLFPAFKKHVFKLPQIFGLEFDYE